jgi:hypothetical protein
MDDIKLIDKEELLKKITGLSKVDLSKVSYPKILHEILNIGGFPLTLIEIKKGEIISRARFNDNDDIFFSEEQISYRNDIMKITNFGRANIPYHSVFYGAIGGSDPNLLYVTPIYELKLNNILPLDFKKGKITIGYWEVINSFEVWNIVFADELSEKNNRYREDVESYIETYSNKYPSKIEDIKYLLKFITKEFIKRTNNNNDYKISASYAKICMDRGISGIIYPSFETEYNGVNIALSHKVIDKNLKLKYVDIMDIEKDNDSSFTGRITSRATELGFLNSDFIYEAVNYPKSVAKL